MISGLVVRAGIGSWTTVPTLVLRGLSPGGALANHMPPYVTVYMWRRTA